MFKWFLNKALYGAVKKRDYANIYLAIRRGADPNSYQFKGLTTLMHACLTGEMHIVGLLIKVGADPNKLDKSGNFNTYKLCTQHDMEPMIERINLSLSIYNRYIEMGIDPIKRI